MVGVFLILFLKDAIIPIYSTTPKQYMYAQRKKGNNHESPQ